MTDNWTPLSKVTPRQRDAIVKAALDENVVNDVTRRRSEELVSELSEGLATLTGQELAARTALIWELRRANRPKR